VRAARITRDLHRLLDHYFQTALRVRAQRLRGALATGGRPAHAYSTDAEAIHDLRVAARRLTAGLRLWRPVLDSKARRRALRLLRRARQRFGPLREIEVHAAMLAIRARRPAAVRTSAAFAQIARAWREEYVAGRREALARLSPQRLGSLRARLDEALAGLPERLADPSRLTAVRRRRSSAAQAGRAALASAANADPAAIAPFHAARIAVKKWRYAEERWHEAMNTQSPILDRLRKIQETLGGAHDCATLRQAIGEAIVKTRTREPKSLETLTQDLSREERAILESFQRLVGHQTLAPSRHP
jgi:CHAD domain-containing protein